MTHMAQPHKGPRTQVKTRVPDEVVALIEQVKSRQGVSSVSQYIADVLCHVLNHPELALELQREEVQFSLPFESKSHAA
jgi:hypothetical protein